MKIKYGAGKSLDTKVDVGKWSVGKCAKSGKFQYETEELAHKAAKVFRKSHGPKLQQYICWYCKLWHNGHNRGGKYNESSR